MSNVDHLTNIFAKHAPTFWAAGHRVIPVEPRTKRPAINLNGWQGHLGSLPTAEKQTDLVSRYPGHGLGLLLGAEVDPNHVLIALDVDDDRLVSPALQFLGLNRATRRAVLSGKRGKKGGTFFVLAPKADKIRSTVLKGTAGLGNIDLLAAGKMTVMPPSIHPDTGAPYEYLETPLLEAPLSDLPVIGKRELKVLRAALGSEHTVTLIDGKSTHEAGVALVAKLMVAGATDDEIIAIVSGLLPADYAGDSLKELPGWIESARAKGFDEAQSSGGKSRSMAAAVLAIATESEVELFHDGDGAAYATVPGANGPLTMPVMSGAFRSWLRGLVYRQLDASVPAAALYDAIASLEAMALYDGPRHQVFSRVAGDRNVVEVDLGPATGKVVRIDSAGWELVDRPSHRFVRGAGFESLPLPERGGSLRELQPLLNLDDQAFVMTCAFMLSALRPRGPYPLLLIEGEQGAGKSFFAETVKMIVDPNRAPKLRLPDNDRDLMIQAKEYHLLSFDNASGMRADISDALCSLATGGAISVRKLYSDAELNVLSYARPVIINGISGYVNRPDLMERAFPVALSPMPAGSRRSEDELRAALSLLLPRVLGALFDAVSLAIRNYAGVEPPHQVRMMDAARWVVAGEDAFGVPKGTVLQTIVEAQTDFLVARVNDDALIIKLREIVQYQPFEGYVGDLLAKVRDVNRVDPALPRSPSHLSRALDRLRPAAALAGVHIEFLEKDRKGKRIRIRSDDQIEMPDHLKPLMQL